MDNIDIQQAVADKLNNLFNIAEQLRASYAATDETRQGAKKLETSSTVVSDLATLISEATGDDVEGVYALADKLSAYATAIAPKTATTLWKNEEVQKEIDGLKGMASLGFLTDDQVTVLNGIAADFSKGSRVRGPRNDAPTIEGRPSRVWLVSSDDPTKAIRNMSGNTAQSAGNAAKSLASFLKVDKEDDRYKVLTEYARQACNGETVAISGTDLSLVPMIEDESGDMVQFTK